MCGIFCSVTNSTTNANKLHTCNGYDELIKSLHARGPDKISKESVALANNISCHLIGCVLWMQGNRPVQQPIKDKHGNLLLWNGEVFNEPWAANSSSSDSILLSTALEQTSIGGELPLEVISKIRGPFSFIYLDVIQRRLWFGRDKVGRHSLLVCKDYEKQLVLSSVGNNRTGEFKEVPVAGIFCLNLDMELSVTLYAWSDYEVMEDHLIFPATITSSTKIQSPIVNPINIPASPPCDIETMFYQLNDSNLTDHEILEKMAADPLINDRVINLIKLLRASVKVRTETQPKLCKACIEVGTFDCSHSKIGVLFSGGLDSAVLAILADEFVPLSEPIDLMNVAFERIKRGEGNDTYNVPDRKTGRQTLEELQLIRPNRKWQFLEINVTKEELEAKRSERITSLIYPLDTILDDSLGCALWFASQSQGTLADSASAVKDEKVTSPVRVLLLGMGADEQLGGYMRHRTTLKHNGWSMLATKMKADVDNIATRNLGRDDRIVSDGGRQGRLPYLDEQVINYLNSLCPWEKCYPVSWLPPGTGDKYLLRLAARSLGLKKVAVLPKRALQFGSRIANSREKGSDKKL